MAFRRRRTFRRKKNFRRRYRTRKLRVRKRMSNIVHSYSRWITNNTGVAPDTVTLLAGQNYIGGGLSFTFNQVSGFTDLYNLYDFYRINAIKVRFVPDSNVTVEQAGGGVYPDSLFNNRFLSAIDYNDVSAPASSSAGSDIVRQYKNSKMTWGNRIHQRFFKPRVRDLIYDPDANQAYTESKRKQWIAMDGPVPNDQHGCHVPHYGIKYIYQQVTAPVANDVVFRIEAKIYFQCKNPR